MMRYKVTYAKRADKQLSKLDAQTRVQIIKWISKNLVGCEDPRAHGKPLTADRQGQWRYRVGDYRLICDIFDTELVILVLEIGHRREVYKN